MDTLNYRVGIGTTSPITTFGLKGSQYLTGGLGVGNATTTGGILETSGIAYIGGIIKGASTFTFAGTGASTMSGALGIATTTPAERFSINGGAFFDSDIIRFGSSSAPTLNFRYFASSTSTIPNLTSAFTYATSTTNTPLLTLSTKSSRYGRVGIGTSSPSALFAINALNASNQADNLFYVGSSTQNTFIIDNHGFVGVGTTTNPGAPLIVSGSVGGSGISRGIARFETTADIARIFIDSASCGYLGIRFRNAGSQVFEMDASAGSCTYLNFADSNDVQANIRNDLSAQNDDGWVTATIDYAEFMEKLDPTEDIHIYDVIGIKNGKITKNTEGAVLNMITSTDAGIRGGNPLVEGYSRDKDPNWLAVAYIGQMPILVEGEVNEGDYIIPSGNNDGRAKAMSPDTITRNLFNQAIGRALESDDNPIYNTKNVHQDPNDPEQDSEIFFELEKMQQRRDNANIINVAVGTHMGWPKLDPSISGGEVQGGGWIIDQTTGRLTTAYGLDLGGNSIENVKAIMSASGRWRIDESGLLVVEEVRAKRGTFEEGVTIYDKVTREPRCAYFENGVWTSVIGECGAPSPVIDDEAEDLVE